MRLIDPNLSSHRTYTNRYPEPVELNDEPQATDDSEQR